MCKLETLCSRSRNNEILAWLGYLSGNNGLERVTKIHQITRLSRAGSGAHDVAEHTVFAVRCMYILEPELQRHGQPALPGRLALLPFVNNY